ncbi:MAG: PEP-CTERM sorting domain-containing protein [Verrucomicrobiota bacterium]|jgi:hypothetical protein|nr:PEP-CTERM sorting domain-containing protein [Verrucomicrobiota bacterium]MDD8047460.1 PEP-CTERM sorting domain-containing protein [Verrucomicrobiota bacterium]MDD8050028.1 PEP-CTERM sorting domain-containing protein [Verrucomicrobiota bacterium]MDI9384165.1 PEP-CTERM sorting domain-containing protein [Verrucomicrobiota bacterium]HCF94171.1 hypothetical protein [Verrucomicrobiota bacterium]
MLAFTHIHGARGHGILAMLAAVLLLCLDALAQGAIVYRDIEDVPLFTLSGSVLYDLDLDQNGSVDLTFRARASQFDVLPRNESRVLATQRVPPDLSTYAVPLEMGEEIQSAAYDPFGWNPLLTLQSGAEIGSTFSSCILVGDDLGCLGLFTGRNAYMGAEFQIDGQPHYGWLRVDVSQLGINGGWIMEYAYDTRPGMPILAGAVPEPSTWALLVGGGVLMMWSRKRHGRKG